MSEKETAKYWYIKGVNTRGDLIYKKAQWSYDDIFESIWECVERDKLREMPVSRTVKDIGASCKFYEKGICQNDGWHTYLDDCRCCAYEPREPVKNSYLHRKLPVIIKEAASRTCFMGDCNQNNDDPCEDYEAQTGKWGKCHEYEPREEGKR